MRTQGWIVPVTFTVATLVPAAAMASTSDQALLSSFTASPLAAEATTEASIVAAELSDFDLDLNQRRSGSGSDVQARPSHPDRRQGGGHHRRGQRRGDAAAAPVVGADTPRSWSVSVIPYAWGKALRGHIEGAGRSAPVRVPLRDAFNSLEGIFMGEVSVDGPRWGAYFDYQGTDNREDENIANLSLDARVRMRGMTGGVYYVAHEENLGGTTINGDPKQLRIMPLVGARWTRTRADLDVLGVAEVGKQVNWTDAIIGLRTDVDLTPHWTLMGHVDTGGFDPGKRFSINSEVRLGYRLKVMNKPAKFLLGYELLFQEYQQDDFTGNPFVWKMTSYGPTAGFSITF